MLISIITPTFNSEKYILETIKSIEECRSFCNCEIEHIVVDAGSQDNTKRIVESFGQSKWIDFTNSTMYEAIDLGFRRSRGDFLCWLNSDDIFLPHTLATWLEMFHANPDASIVTGGTVYIDAECKELYPYKWVLNQAAFIESFSSLMLSQPSTCWRRHVYFQLGGFDLNLKIIADRDFFVRAVRTFGIILSSKPLSGFRVHGQNLTSTKRELSNFEADLINKKISAGPTSFKRSILSVLGHIVTKVSNPKMIFWRIRMGKRSLF